MFLFKSGDCLTCDQKQTITVADPVILTVLVNTCNCLILLHSCNDLGKIFGHSSVTVWNSPSIAVQSGALNHSRCKLRFLRLPHDLYKSEYFALKKLGFFLNWFKNSSSRSTFRRQKRINCLHSLLLKAPIWKFCSKFLWVELILQYYATKLC